MNKIDLNYLKEIFEADIITMVENKRFPGMAMSIIENGTKIYSFGVGYRDIETCKEFNGDTLARFGSITKSFTSLAILLLEDQGKLSVNDPIVKYLSINPREKKHQITIHHLLTHTSGISVHIDEKAYNEEEYLTQVTGIINETREDFGKSKYSNIGYTLLAMIIEKVLDESFDNAIRELILEPLQMNRTILLCDEELNSSDTNITIPYKPIKKGEDNPGFVKAEYEFSRLTKGPGGIISSCNEMLVFIDMLINNGSVGGKTIFKPKIFEKMLTRYVKLEDLSKLLHVDSYDGYGIGIKDDYKGQTFINAAGSILGGISLIGLYKEAKIGFSCIGNSDGFPLMFIYDVWDKVLEHDPLFKRINRKN